MSILQKTKKAYYHFSNKVQEKTAQSLSGDAENKLSSKALKEEKREKREELEAVRSFLAGFNTEHIWAFNSGNTGEEFRGNPKYLFAYINNYRKDIRAYWVSQNEETVKLVRSLGFFAVLSNTPAAKYAASKAGVAVSEQVRGIFPFPNAKYLNLWHGVGYKACERSRISDEDDMRLSLAKKYIKFNELYKNRMLLVAASPFQEGQLKEFIGLEGDNIIRTGYPRCCYQRLFKPISTFDNDLLKRKNLPEGTTIAVYAPTFRTKTGNTFSRAMEDFEALYSVCEKAGILLVFKMHPLMQSETGFIMAKQHYENRPYFYFWDNQDDFYEVIDKVDLLIYDYSSIFNDCLIAGTKHFIRYIFDGENMREAAAVDSEEDYYNNTAGEICQSFSQLLDAIEHFRDKDDSEKLSGIRETMWTYSDDDIFEKTIKATFDFKIKKDEYPTLYSFDIFDTLFTRKGLTPESIFYAVRDKMVENGGFPRFFTDRFPYLRESAEKNVREYMYKSQDNRESFHTEISMDQIYTRLQKTYEISDAQVEQLKKWETEAEIESVIPLRSNIDLLKQYVCSGEKVVLVSDMYLPREIIREMLRKADPALADLPLFLSNEYGVLKTSRLLFFEVYRSFKPHYNFKKWIHYGDNENADQRQPRNLDICTRKIPVPVFSKIENKQCTELADYDAFKVAAMQARMREEYGFARAGFVIDFIAPLMVSYVDWAVRDALKKGFELLYFVSRDGHPLKRIADAIIKQNGWQIETRYIYASRRVWRIPSYFDRIDPGFWSNQGGNFNDIVSKDKFLRALNIAEEKFKELFPQIDIDSVDFSDWDEGQPAKKIIQILKDSPVYEKYLLEKAAEERELPCEYLRQEIDRNKKHAFVEFWGRGYNQLCHSRLWNYVVGEETPLYYYYARTVDETEGNCIRYNMTVDKTELFFVESFFANIPYKSIESYKREDGRIVPVIEPLNCDTELFAAMEKLLPEFAERYSQLGLSDYENTDRRLFDFIIDYYWDNKQNPFIYENIGSLIDSVAIYGPKNEFARPYTSEDLENFKNGVPRGRGTMSMVMSYARMNEKDKKEYDELFQVEPGEDPTKNPILRPEQLAESRSYKERLAADSRRAQLAEKMYRDFSQKENVDSSIVVITANRSVNSDSLHPIKKALKTQDKYSVRYISAKCPQKEDEGIMRELAKARFVLVEGNVKQLSGIDFRPETTVIGLQDHVFRSLGFGHTMDIRIKNKKKYDIFLNNIRFDKIENIGSKVSDVVIRSCRLPLNVADDLKGCCVTDLYFDKDFKEKSRAKFEAAVPMAKGKKIISYITHARHSGDGDDFVELLDIERMAEELSDEYVLALDMRNNEELSQKAMNVVNIPGFSRKVDSSYFSLRTMIAAADVIIGDYRDIVFEAALLRKPIFSSGYDYETRMNSTTNMLYDYSKMNPFPIVRNADEAIKQIKNLSDYDYGILDEFCKNFFENCDGQSAPRLVEWILKQ
ncbi:MAG: CDP-glycerol glycerophosphotransferase family protein [Lachnospiraceae bacterium]|nr:CDP-glycerol glycerophosphotransferase family protein [Lachnospiraceae bacterium]